MSNVVQMKMYKLVRIDGKERLACRIGKKWVLDKTCQNINEMLDNNLINLNVVNGWIQAS